jgi:hypothetical protein
MADDISERVIELVSEQTGWNPRAITPDTEIERDLGCTGDAARELLFRLEREMDIDMTGMEFRNHFSEGAPRWPLAVPVVLALPSGVLAMHLIGLLARAVSLELPAFTQRGWFFVVVVLACAAVIWGLTTLIPADRVWGVNKTPVKVQHLIDAARLGRWPLSVSQREVA